MDTSEVVRENLAKVLESDNESRSMAVSYRAGRREAYDAQSGITTTSGYNPNALGGHGTKEKSRKRIMEHYQRMDDEKCYYSNPIRCSFDDPRLIFEEMCYLCGSFGNQEDFVTCMLCGESFHDYCLRASSKDMPGLD